MAEFFTGMASGVGLCIGAVAALGLYVKRHQEKMMRLFIRRAMGAKRNAGNHPNRAASDTHS